MVLADWLAVVFSAPLSSQLWVSCSELCDSHWMAVLVCSGLGQKPPHSMAGQGHLGREEGRKSVPHWDCVPEEELLQQK